MGYFATRLTKYFNTASDMLVGEQSIAKLCGKFVVFGGGSHLRQNTEIVLAQGRPQFASESIAKLLAANRQAIEDRSFRYLRWHLYGDDGAILIAKLFIRFDRIPSVCIQFEPLGSSDAEHQEILFKTICRKLTESDDRCVLESIDGYFASPLALYVHRKLNPTVSAQQGESLTGAYTRMREYFATGFPSRLTMTSNELSDWLRQFDGITY